MEPDDPLLGTVVGGRYRIERKLGEGGMSCVYEAKHLKLHRSFAIKVLLPSLVDNTEAHRRFALEAEMLAGLNHPNVVIISDSLELDDGSPCMVLEYLHGATLRARMTRGPLPWEAIARIGDQVMSALTLAHRNGITHRDLKPDNVFLAIDDVGDERVKLLDFGVSKLRGVGTMTGIYNMLGTPSYMSPEQATGNSEAIGPSTDVWAMGTILYELATGRVAFAGDSLADTLMRITTTPPDPIAAFRPDAPPAFVELLGRAMSLDPARRLVEIDDLRAGLRDALDPRNMYRLNTPIRGVPIVTTGSMPLTPPRPPTGQSPPILPIPVHIAASGTSAIRVSSWTRRRVLWIAGIAALLVSGGAAAIALAM
ncbi:MAG TPA: serine/threonine-protein kinase [Kofleriaceae bacterium]